MHYENEIRIYHKQGKNRIRVAKLSALAGLWNWIRLYFTLKKYSVKG